MRYILPILIAEQRTVTLSIQKEADPKKKNELEARLFPNRIERDYAYLEDVIAISPPSLVTTYYNVFISGLAYINFDFCEDREVALHVAFQRRMPDCALFNRRFDCYIDAQRRYKSFAGQVQQLSQKITAFNLHYKDVVIEDLNEADKKVLAGKERIIALTEVALHDSFAEFRKFVEDSRSSGNLTIVAV